MEGPLRRAFFLSRKGIDQFPNPHSREGRSSRMRVSVGSKAIMTLTLPGNFVVDSPSDAARAAELRRVKMLATLVLAVTFAVFIGAKWMVPVHPIFGFIAAFAEAATIGGLADWYAVVALFRRPLGLPIP